MDITERDIGGLIDLTKVASNAIMEIYSQDATLVEYKADDSPLTQADKDSHDIIVKGLEELFPNIPIISEESDTNISKTLLGSTRFWLVDPLDGTQDFVNRTGEFCVAIGLIENNKPSFGLVAAPTFDTVYYGGPGMGSFKKVGDNEPQPIHTKRLEPHVVGISRTHVSEPTQKLISERWPDSELRPLGSMLKQVKLAEGEIDIYPTVNQPLKLWDAAAGNAIIEGAGGLMTKPNGQPLDYSDPSLLIGDFIARAED